MQPSSSYSSRTKQSDISGFTLIELLVVIAIIAILAVVVVLVLNPAALLQQSRDSSRLSDLSTITNAVNIYNIDQTGSSGYSLGASGTVYISVYDLSATTTAGDQCQGLGMPMVPTGYSYGCAASTSYRNVNATGWLPTKFSNISSGAPFGNLPVDPVNQTSSNLYYTYETNGSVYQLSASLESSKYAKTGATDGSSDPTLVEAGSGVSSLPDTGRGLVGYWPLDEGQGSTAYDWSGNGSNGTFGGSPTWITGHVWASGLQEANGNYVNFITPSASLPTSSITVALWENTNTSTFQSFTKYLNNNWNSAPGSWLLYSNSIGALSWGITGPATSTQNAASCPGLLTLNTWQFLVGTYDGATMRTYINGVQCRTVSLSGQSLWTGSHLDNNPGTAGDSVITNDVRVYGYALSAAEIATLYNTEH